MKYSGLILLLAFFVSLNSCNEQVEQESREEGKTLLFENVSDDPDTIILKQIEENYFGVDYEGDTVIYVQEGVIQKSGVVTGTFYKLERGDFLHFVLADSNGLLHSFFMNTGDQRQMDKYYEGYEPSRGHPVTVKWVREPLMVSDGGVMMTVYQAKEIYE